MSEKELERILKDLSWMEGSDMYLSEKKYYIKLIDTLATYGYYKNRKTLREIWSK